MTKWFVVYTKDGCLMCLRTKELLQVMGADFYEEVLPTNDNWPTPVVFLEEDYVGGYYELQNYFKRKVKNVRRK